MQGLFGPDVGPQFTSGLGDVNVSFEALPRKRRELQNQRGKNTCRHIATRSSNETEAQEIGKGIFENRGQTKRSPGFASPSLYLNDKGTGDEAAHRPGDAS